MLPVHNFSYGVLTPGLAYAMSCLGAFLGLRCTTRAIAHVGRSRAKWLILAAVSIGVTGIWVMHFIAMLGYTVPAHAIRYSVPVTILSMLIAVAVVAIGLLIVGFGRPTWRNLLLAGTITGLGVASMHYSGMAAMRMPAAMSWGSPLVAASVLIAIIAATAALWAAVRLRGVWHTFIAALVMGVAVSGMHYTGMAAMKVSADSSPASMVMTGATAQNFLLPLIIGISVLTFLLTATITLSPTDAEIRAEGELLSRIGEINAAGPASANGAARTAGRHGPVIVVSRGEQERQQARRRSEDGQLLAAGPGQ
jgi:NO-binding membrane sensor protein with MHYT domain